MDSTEVGEGEDLPRSLGRTRSHRLSKEDGGSIFKAPQNT